MSRRIVDIYYDVAGSRHLNSSYNPISDVDIPWFYVNEMILINLRAVIGINQGGDNATPPPNPFRADLSWSVAVDSAYGQSTMAAKASNDVINLPGDFAGGNANPLSGQMSVRLDCNGTRMNTLIGSSPKTVVQMEVQGRDGDGLLCYVLRLNLTLKNLMDKGGAVPVDPPIWLISRDEANAKFAPRIIPDRFMIHPVHGALWCFPDGQWRKLEPFIGDDGKATFAPSDPIEL